MCIVLSLYGLYYENTLIRLVYSCSGPLIEHTIGRSKSVRYKRAL